jgi:hypothetical protein
VGFAIGTGTDVAIEVSDVTVIKGSLIGVVTAIEISLATIASRSHLHWEWNPGRALGALRRHAPLQCTAATEGMAAMAAGIRTPITETGHDRNAPPLRTGPQSGGDFASVP